MAVCLWRLVRLIDSDCVLGWKASDCVLGWKAELGWKALEV
jgi:hypothetical protein